MNPSDSLRRHLVDLASYYTGLRRNEIELRFDDDGRPRMARALDGPGNPTEIIIYIDPSPVQAPVGTANELRFVRDDLNHECAHYLFETGKQPKAEFAERYPDHRRLAAGVWNILEDAYLDSRRGREWNGLRSDIAAFADHLVDTAPPLHETPTAQALVNGLHQIALAGRVSGDLDAVEPKVRAFLGWARPYVEQLRREPTFEAREAIIAHVVEQLIEILPDKPDLDLDDLVDALNEVVGEDEIDDVVDYSEQNFTTASEVDESEVESMNLPDDLDIEFDEDELDASSGGDSAEQDEDADEDEAGGGEGDEDEDAQDAESGDESEGSDETDEDTGDGEDGDTDDESGQDGDESGEAMPEDTTGSGQGDGDSGVDEHERPDERPDIAAELDDMADCTAGEWHDVAEGADYRVPDEQDRDLAEQVVEDSKFENTAWGERQADRDERIRGTPSRGDVSSERIREILRETGLAERIRTAFSRFKTEDVTVRRESGDRLNIGAVVRHMAGDYGETRVYDKTYRAATGGRSVCVVLDISSSMRNSGHLGPGAVVDAKVALGALHLATHEMGDELMANAFSTGYSGNTCLITGPDEGFEWDHLDSVGPSGSTPAADGVLEGREILKRAGGKDRIMVVVTDGQPNRGATMADLDDNGDGVEATSLAVRLARQDGIKVFGFSVGGGVPDENMLDMFGAGQWSHTSSDTLVEDLVDMYRSQLDLSPQVREAAER